MLNATDTIETVTARRDSALATLEAAAKRCREHGNGPLADIYSDDLDLAFAALEVAEDDLREIRDGYRNTYPHPMGKVHPHDGYRPGRG